MNEKSIEQMIYEETEKRLKIMEDPNYDFPEKATKADAIAIVVTTLVCLVLIVMCMIGVIN